IAFVLGHALYMKAIHGGKSADDRIDSQKIAQLVRGGNLPIAYVYPKGLRETRDLLRRRMYLVHKRAEVVAHVVHTNSQYNLPPFGKQLIYARNRQALKAERALRPIAVGRKNYMFFGSDVGGQTAAVLYSFTQTCQHLGVEPWRYLRDVLERLP